jgi:hypothetical protein
MDFSAAMNFTGREQRLAANRKKILFKSAMVRGVGESPRINREL